MPQVFILGITGYVGGTLIQKLSKSHPNLEITALVRSEDKASAVTSAYPSIKTVIGDLESHDLISSESAKADIVLSLANCDHEGHIKDIYNGMGQHSGTSYLIHTSGTGILTDPTREKTGQRSQSTLSDKVYDDIKDVDAIITLPDENLHRLVDRLVIETAPTNVKHAIICPPLIYGKGTGPSNQNSIQTPQLLDAMLKHGRPFTVTEGQGHWSNVHVKDLADLYVILVDDALNGGKAEWGSKAYYFAENGEHDWIDLSRELGKILKKKGIFETEEVEHLSREGVEKLDKNGTYSWGTNSKSKASRGRELGWKPTQCGFFESLEQEVDDALARK